jgi:glycosyltransferase 2 family protein
MSRKHLIVALRTVVSLALIGYLLRQAEPARLLEAWRAIIPGWLLAAIALTLLGTCINAAKWTLLLRAREIRLPYLWAVRAYFIGSFFNNFLPTMIGGDAVRALLLSQRIGQAAPAIASIFVERLTGFVALTVIGGVSLFLSYSLLADAPRLLLATLALGLAAALALTLALVAAPLARLLARLRLRNVADWRGKLARMADALSGYRHHRGTLLASVAIAFCYQLVWIGSNVAAARALGIDAPYSFFALMVPMSDIVGLVPIFLNSLGAREGTFTLFLGQIGVGTAQALALAFLVFSVRLVSSLLGGLLYLLGGAAELPSLADSAKPAAEPPPADTVTR